VSSAAPELQQQETVREAVALEARTGLLSNPRTLSPWLFYDERGSGLFEQITELPEYYLTRTERAILTAHADEILSVAADGRTLSLLELGAGTATKTGILLAAAIRQQGSVFYQPVDVSPSALAEAADTLQARIPGCRVRPQVANYITEPLSIERPAGTRTLALYIGSSIGNFSPAEAVAILRNLRSELEPGDGLLLGTDLGPGRNKSVETLVAAYDDRAGVTAAFNRNLLTRLNRDLGSDFDLACFAHRALWNPELSRMEMHLESLSHQQVRIPANAAGPALLLTFQPGETIHTENSYKFTALAITDLLSRAGFRTARTFADPQELFAVTLAAAA
jgi:dimethylhistidine N-methyltransferase